jgi:hypothetical protein
MVGTRLCRGNQIRPGPKNLSRNWDPWPNRVGVEAKTARTERLAWPREKQGTVRLVGTGRHQRSSTTWEGPKTSGRRTISWRRKPMKNRAAAKLSRRTSRQQRLLRELEPNWAPRTKRRTVANENSTWGTDHAKRTSGPATESHERNQISLRATGTSGACSNQNPNFRSAYGRKWTSMEDGGRIACSSRKTSQEKSGVCTSERR